MRAHLFYCLKALRAVNRMADESVLLDAHAQRELGWCAAALVDAHKHAVPMASRREFPSSDEPGVLTTYGDASREVDDNGVVAPSSGFGAWTVLDEVFYFIEGRWSAAECRAYSINILEFATENMGTFTFTAHARSMGVPVSHVHAFVDNTSAEFVSERGRTQSAGMNHLNETRQRALQAQALSQRTSRVPSIFNDVADLLSRGDVAAALRVPTGCGLPIARLPVHPGWRDMDAVPVTWD